MSLWEQVGNKLTHIDWQFSPGDLFALVLLIIWLWLIWPKRDFSQLLMDKGKQRRLLWVLMAVNLLWMLNASIYHQLHVHFLGLVVLMQMFGWRLASIAVIMPVSLFALLVQGQAGWIAPYALFGSVLPLFISFTIYSRGFHLLPRNLFVYLFCAGFFNAGLVLISHMLLWGSWLWLTTDYIWSELVDSYFNLIPLLAFPEALLNGMALTLLVVYRPEWLYDFRDNQYWPMGSDKK
ncbi:MAG: hypothetical protein LPH21_07660 [Shewanella sp.]|nr:hypothetical protein [Shewanella sp.]MCF1430523.1 hypothetical protein [Shewanella sp.]MCF1457434.1 hypothetical protein [Shewanella sp.]